MLRVKPVFKNFFLNIALASWPITNNLAKSTCFCFVYFFSFYPFFCNWPFWPFSFLATLPLLASVTMVTCYSSCASGLLLLRLWPAMHLLFAHFSILPSTIDHLLFYFFSPDLLFLGNLHDFCLMKSPHIW